MKDDNDSSARPKNAERVHPPVDTIEDVIVFKLSRFSAMMERLGHRWSERLFGLSLNEWRMLGLVQARQPVRAGDLAAAMLKDKSQLSRLIRSLTAQDLIQSQPDTEDARAIALSLTPKGTELFHEIMAEVMRRNEDVLAALDIDEVAQFNGLLNRLLHHSGGLLEARQGGES